MALIEREHYNWEDFVGLTKEEIEAKAREILSKLTIKEKVKKMAGDWTFVTGGIGMAIRYNSKPIPAGVIKELGIPGIRFSDGPRGCVMGASTCFPVSMARGASWDVDLEERVGDAIGIELRSQGANFFGGVCINLLRHPAWGRAQETFGEDSFHLGMMGSALVKGTQKHVMACAKHYACNSMENMRFKVDVNISERTLREIYLPHFKMCVDNGVASIMSAYNIVNGEYCGHNRHILTEILKQDWKFEGFVISDFIFGVRDGKKAVNGGMDIEMPFNFRMKPKKLIKLLEQEEISLEDIDDSVLRILRQEIRFAKKEDNQKYNAEMIACRKHRDLALEVANKSVVLLKNENETLPLSISKIKKITLFGKLARMPNIGDLGSSRVFPPYVITPLEGIKKLIGNSAEIIQYDGKDLEEARKLASESDVSIVIAGFTRKEEGEYLFNKGGDRKTLELTSKDEQLILAVSKTSKKSIVVLEAGSAIITENWREKVSAILMAWYPGMEGGNAIANIIFGNVNPSAKLPVSFAKSNDQYPFFDRKAKSINYDYYHGYHLIDKKGYTPAFSFGFGLSYTKFEYSNLKIEKDVLKSDEIIKASIEIENTGSFDGEEITQLYVGYENSEVDRPIKDLKGFQKKRIKSKEKITLEFKIHPDQLKYYDENSKTWVLEAMEYSLYIGGSSAANDLMQTHFEITSL